MTLADTHVEEEVDVEVDKENDGEIMTTASSHMERLRRGYSLAIPKNREVFLEQGELLSVYL